MRPSNTHEEQADREARRRLQEQAERLGHVQFAVTVKSAGMFYANYGTMAPELGDELIALMDRWAAEGQFGEPEGEVG